MTKGKSPQLRVSLNLAQGIPPGPSQESLGQGAGLLFWPLVCVMFVELSHPAYSPAKIREREAPPWGRSQEGCETVLEARGG